MSRPSKGARLVTDSRTGFFLIQDGQERRGTGCGPSDRTTAERKLAEYIISKRDPAKAIDKSNPNAAQIADVLSLEMKRIAAAAMPDDRKKELITVCENMVKWFGNRTVGDLDGEIQERYAAERVRFVMKKVGLKRISVATDQHAPIAAYRDLKILAAAVNRYLKRKVGGVQARFSPVLPDAPEARERCLDRSEAARLLWAAWRAPKGRRDARHIARFLLVALYTGSRKGDICGAALMPTIGRGYIDLERGIFKRKPDDKKATSKRQPTVPIPPRLLAHARRWRRLGISQNAVVEFNGKPVNEVKAAFATVVELAGLATDIKKDKVIPHTLRHTAITWYLAPDRRTGRAVDIELVSQYTGVSVTTIRKTYRHEMPGQYDKLLDASQTFGRSK